jgi:hypothetical protein
MTCSYFAESSGIDSRFDVSYSCYSLSTGAIGISIANPTELIKIRMQADRSGTRYSGVLDAFSKIIKSEGMLSFF